MATAVASAEPEGAARLVGAAVALRAGAGATPTRREGAEVAAALTAIGAGDPRLLEVAQGADAEVDEVAAIALAARLRASADDGMPDRTTTARRHGPARE